MCHRSVPQHSALHDYLQPGDAITDVNGCAVASADALRACIFLQVSCSQASMSQQHLIPWGWYSKSVSPLQTVCMGGLGYAVSNSTCLVDLDKVMYKTVVQQH